MLQTGPSSIEHASLHQVSAKDNGDSIPGVTLDTARQFLMDLLDEIVRGELQPDKLPVAISASGLMKSHESGVPFLLADAIW